MTVDPTAIRLVLDESSDPKAKSADPRRFYDNSLIQAVNREYAAKLFPGEVKLRDAEKYSARTTRKDLGGEAGA
jgi:hypothetical protein